MKTGIIVVAAGSGARMGAEVPKQFLPLAGRPLLMHTIERLAAALPGAPIVVVLAEAWRTRWALLCERYAFGVPHTVASGGANRFESVRAALPALAGCELVGVHDGVRPLVSAELILRVRGAAAERGAAIPVVPVVDSLRRVTFRDGADELSTATGSAPVDRGALRAVQTPQFFRARLLVSAYRQAWRPGFTDDASVVEAAGTEVALVEGEAANIKITTPVDLALAGVLIKNSTGGCCAPEE